jgi:hypothetical protein
MEAGREITITRYGQMIKLPQLIPQLVCKETAEAGRKDFHYVDCKTHKNIFPIPESIQDNVRDNRYILSLINRFVDYFILYHTDYSECNSDYDVKTLLDLKKVIFMECFGTEEHFKYFITIIPGNIIIENHFEVPVDITDPTTEVVIKGGIYGICRLQKKMNLFLLCLSYITVSLSSMLGINIKVMDDIIEHERTKNKSFILQFLPTVNTKTHLRKILALFSSKIESIIIRKLRELMEIATAKEATDGGALNHIKIGIKFQKNKSRRNKNKNKYKKSRKHFQFSRRKRRENKIL